MSWIKRNLFFLIGSVIAVVLLGLAGFYLYSKWDLNNKVLDELTQKHEDLKKLNAEPMHPGSGNINNIEIARDQIKQVKAALEKTRTGFQSIPRIPDMPKITDFEFSTTLAQTIAQLTRDGTNSGVTLPATNYAFSFSAQRNRMNFTPTSLQPLSAQLGEVKTICDILFAAKVNSLESIRRERISADDLSGSQSDYLSEKSITNAMAVLTPYEVTFHCFSPELAGVLSGFANSPHGFIVQYLNIEIAPAVTVEPTPPPMVVYQQPVVPTPTAPTENRDTMAAFRARYGLAAGGPQRYQPQPQPQPYQPPVAVATTAAKTGPQTVIDERKLRVTMLVQIVKLKDSQSPAQAPPPAARPRPS